MKRSESQIVSSICQYLNAKRYFFWRQNNGGVWDEKRGVYRTNKNVIKGVPDIFAVPFRNYFYAIEIKTASGEQSPDQRLFQQKWEDRGGFYILARSVDDVIKAGL